MNNHIDLNRILKVANICVVSFSLYLFFTSSEPNPYLDSLSLLISFSIAVSVHLMLNYEEKTRSPLLLVFLLYVIVFYQLRVATLLYDPSSLFVLNPNSLLTHEQFNLTLFYLLLCAWVIFFGLLTKKRLPINRYISNDGDKYRRVSPIWLIFFVLSFFFAPSLYNQYFTHIGAAGEYLEVSRIDKAFLTLLFRSEVILTIFFVYIISNKHFIEKRYFCILLILTCLMPLLSMIGGSRSGVVNMLIYILFARISIENRFVFRKWILVTIPFIVVIMIITFSLATVIRYKSVTIEDKQNVIDNVQQALLGDRILNRENINALLRDPILRLGYLDMTADVMHNATEYSRLINVSFIAMATFEGLLPGVHLFNTGGRTANQFRNVVEGTDIYQIRDTYRSDCFTLFGEYYVLFGGILSLIFMFVISRIFKVLYLTVGYKPTFISYYYRAVLIYIFYSYWLSSFGTDWLINETVRTLLVSIIFTNVFLIGSKIRWFKFLGQPVVSYK